MIGIANYLREFMGVSLSLFAANLIQLQALSGFLD
jgi:hypothetical protein